MVETTDNAFLGGKLQLLQPKHGYRAGVDPVLLAAACTPPHGARVLELGCGVGTALFCLAKRVPELNLTGVERHEATAALARENADRNGLQARIVQADLRKLPADIRNESFDLILANPPYFDRASSTPSQNHAREAGRGEDAVLEDWVSVAARRLAPKGALVIIQRVERLPDLIAACAGRLAPTEVLPLAPRAGEAARLIIFKAQKRKSATFCLHPPISLHRSVGASEKYLPEIEAVLREGSALFPS